MAPSSRRPTAPGVALGVVAAMTMAVLFGGCGGARRDATPLRFTSPTAGSTHGLPLALRWTTVRGAAGYVLFVDRAPVAPGAILPTKAIDVVHMTGPEVVLTRLPSVSAAQEKDHHLVVVAVDATGHRLGERAATLDLRIDPLARDVAGAFSRDVGRVDTGLPS